MMKFDSENQVINYSIINSIQKEIKKDMSIEFKSTEIGQKLNSLFISLKIKNFKTIRVPHGNVNS